MTDQPTEAEQLKNICLTCGRDCTFLATAPGLCLPCGDAFQDMDKWKLVMLIARSNWHIDGLCKQIKELGDEPKPVEWKGPA